MSPSGRSFKTFQRKTYHENSRNLLTLIFDKILFSEICLLLKDMRANLNNECTAPGQHLQDERKLHAFLLPTHAHTTPSSTQHSLPKYIEVLII